MAFGWIHGDVEGVLTVSAVECLFEEGLSYTSDDLMKMWRGIRAWVHQRVKSLDCQLRAAKAQKPCLRSRD
jgi:hypothetical protein